MEYVHSLASLGRLQRFRPSPMAAPPAVRRPGWGMLLALAAAGALTAARVPGAAASTSCPNATAFDARSFNWSSVYTVGGEPSA